MSRQQSLSNSIRVVIVLWVLSFALVFCETFAGSVSSAADSLDQLYEKAKKERSMRRFLPER